MKIIIIYYVIQYEKNMYMINKIKYYFIKIFIYIYMYLLKKLFKFFLQYVLGISLLFYEKIINNLLYFQLNMYNKI